MIRFIMITLLLFGSLCHTHGEETLRLYADSLGLNIGVAMGYKFFYDDNQLHNDLVKKEFNTVVAENNMKAASIHPSKGDVKFTRADKLVAFAEENSMKIRGHTLIWHKQNAAWISTGTREEVLENMKYHITTIMEHYKGDIFQWDVVNEAFEDAGPNLRGDQSPYQAAVGADYLDSAFVYAHRADPDCRLFYNDFGTSTINAKSTAIYEMVKTMREKGIPIHGIGFQCHHAAIDGHAGLYPAVKENFERFAKLGLEIAITELDAPGTDFAAQATVYSTFLRIALEMKAVTTYMIWGVCDTDSWVQPTPLIFDTDFQPKPAYTALLEMLKNPPDVGVLPFDRRGVFPAHYGLLSFNSSGNSFMITGIPAGTHRMIDIFNLTGVKIASCAVPAHTPVPLSSVYQASGTLLLRTGNHTLKISSVCR